MHTRREFLHRGLGTATMLSVGSASVPCFVPQSLHADGAARDNGNVLVVIELSGGNDGINTIVPHRDDAYFRNRKKTRIRKDRLHALNDELGWHPALRALNSHWDQGNVAIVQGVGYPNPNRSHFSSMDIWHSARPEASEQYGLGWLGQGLDAAKMASPEPTMMSVGQQATPLALTGRRSVSSSIQRIEQCMLSARQASLFAGAMSAPVADDDDVWSFVQRTHRASIQTAAQLSKLSKVNTPTQSYPKTELARRLQLIARLIRADMGTRVFYTQQDGFDTHSSQLGQHNALLSTYSQALNAFLSDLGPSELGDRVVVMAFSEFGRRVKENAAEGTDHGTAGPVILAGNRIAGGLHGATPSLTDLDAGDLKMTTDFRQVYASLLENWLGLPASAALGGRFGTMPLFA